MHKTTFLLASLWASLSLTCLPAFAQLQSPEQFLGYPIGTKFTSHHRTVAYFEHVAAQAPDRVKLQTYGQSYEGRPLMVAVVTAPQHLARIDDIRQQNLRLAGLAEGSGDVGIPAIVWLAYNVHGNEASATDAALLTLYELARPGSEASGWLQNAVAVIDPCVNPDGRDRYVQFFQQMQGALVNASYAAREHQEPWPGGRWNHYSFDLNRDWAWQSQQETRQRVAFYQQWLPHLYADFHEMGYNNPYFFAPAAEPYHNEITAWQRNFQVTIGRNHAKHFDKNNWLYYTKETFDLLYPSYGDTWPTYNGAIGMTYEQGGGGAGGLAIVTETGDTLTFLDRVLHQHTTGLSTVEVAAANRQKVVGEFKNYYETARTNPTGQYKTFVISGDNDPKRLAELREYLDRNQVRYGSPASPAAKLRGYDYFKDSNLDVALKPTDLVISTAQPKSVLVKVLFNPKTALSDSVTYDATAWSIPYSWGLKAYAFAEKLGTQAYAPAPAPASGAAPGAYAYLAPWKSFTDLKLLAALLQAGLKVRYTDRALSIGGKSYEPGSLVITRADNRQLPNFDLVLGAVAKAQGQVLAAVSSGFADGGADLGSSALHYLAPPRVAVIGGEGISPTSFGEVWHYFDQQIKYPITVVNPSYARRLNFSDFDVLILPGGFYGDIFGENTLGQLKTWLRAGGKVIAMDGALGLFADKPEFGLKTMKQPEGKPDDKKGPAQLRKYANRDRDELPDYVEGSIFRIDLDNSHPLAFGFDQTFFALKRGGATYDFLQNGWNVGTLRDNNNLDGFAGAKVKQRLKNTLEFGVETFGRGSIVYLVNSPIFRSSWPSGNLLFGNAVFFVGQ
jgi:hypothetical protein